MSLLDTPLSTKHIKSSDDELVKLQKEVLFKQNENAVRLKAVLEEASFFFRSGFNFFVNSGGYVTEDVPEKESEKDVKQCEEYASSSDEEFDSLTLFQK